jgi:pimeloyl-ACP methyl ester carboxylesterase
MLSSNSYHNADRVKFAVQELGWIQVDRNGKSTSKPTYIGKASGLAYDIFEKKDTNETIIAFRGTDNKKDYLTANLAPWPFSIQYAAARKVVRLYLEGNPTKKLTVTGHSLGGGLALSASVRLGVDAVVFDSSPRIFDGKGDKHEPATRVMIYEAGEILERVRKIWPKIYTAVPRENIFKGSFDFGGVSKHRSDYLALGLLRLGAEVDPSLVGVLKLLPK